MARPAIKMRLSIDLAKTLHNKFRRVTRGKNETMVDAVRKFITDYIKDEK